MAYHPEALPGVSVKGQLEFIERHPLQFLHIIFNTYRHYCSTYMEQFVGRLGWLDTPLPRILWISGLLVLCLVALIEKNHTIVIEFKQKSLIVCIFLLIIFLIGSVLYISYNAVGNDLVLGIQGRYFIPVAPLFFLLLFNQVKFLRLNQRALNILALFVPIIALTWTLFVLIHRYYIS
jgi:uncharacterized membrane protein